MVFVHKQLIRDNKLGEVLDNSDKILLVDGLGFSVRNLNMYLRWIKGNIGRLWCECGLK